MHDTYRSARNLQKSVNDVQKNLTEFQKNMMRFSNVLGLQCCTYTEKDDEDGIVHQTDTASQFAKYTSDVLRNLSSVLDSTVSGLEKTSKRFASTVMSSSPNLQCSVIQGPVDSMSGTELERQSSTNAIEAYLDLRETVRTCLKSFTEISRSLELHRGDAFMALNIKEDSPRQAENVLKSLNQECINLDRSLHECEDSCGQIIKMNPLKKNDSLRHEFAVALRAVSDSSILSVIRSFISGLQSCKTEWL